MVWAQGARVLRVPPGDWNVRVYTVRVNYFETYVTVRECYNERVRIQLWRALVHFAIASPLQQLTASR